MPKTNRKGIKSSTGKDPPDPLTGGGMGGEVVLELFFSLDRPPCFSVQLGLEAFENVDVTPGRDPFFLVSAWYFHPL